MRNLLISGLILLTSNSGFSQSSDNEIIRTEQTRSLSEINVVVASNISNSSVIVKAPVGSVCQIVSMNGTYVGTWHIELEQIELQDLGSGTFVATIQNGEEVVRRKFVIL